MVIAIVGAGGKTTLLHRLAAQYRAQGKRVLVTTTTRMYLEEDTLLTDDPRQIIRRLEAAGYAMAGLPAGEKLGPLSPETYRAVCPHADIVLVEADGSRHLPLKFPGPGEPAVPANADEILVVWGPHGLGRPGRAACHRWELACRSLGLPGDALLTAELVRRLVYRGYVLPLSAAWPRARIRVLPGGWVPPGTP